ncbi:MAG: PD40 domain-containing protein [Anaerolineaceae bacterium]|nr:PD40 domain-containing protein [Anaerolineaceae bacterium]
MIVLFLCVLAVPVAAQSDPPLLILASGDLWAWDETTHVLRPLTTGGSHFTPVLSPDGGRVAYTAYPDIVVDALQRVGGIGGGPLPKDIWVLDMPDGVNFHVAQQPADASFFMEGVPDRAMIRSRPAWSPDGTWLAWTEALYPEWIPQLTLYNFQTGDIRTIVTGLPQQGGVPDVLNVLWAEAGLVLQSTAYEPETSTWQNTFLVYDVIGTLLREIPLGASTERFMVYDTLVNVAGQEMIGVLYNTGDWDMFDLQTGGGRPASTPELYNTAAPDSLLTVRFLAGAGSEMDQAWLVNAAGATVSDPINLGYTGLDYITLSPDGGAAAYTAFNPESKVFDPNITVWRNGQTTTVILPDDAFIGGFLWGQTGWRITYSEVEGVPAGFSCPGTLPPTLTVGDKGQVIPGSGPNNLRVEASTRGAWVGSIPENGIFTVTAGPVCGDGLVWWLVDYNGQSGWTAESQGDTYFLQPVH